MNPAVDVLIVGMGPVGAALACLLGRSGISVVVVDRELAIFDKPRAIVLDHEALRILQFCGIERAFLDSVSPHTGTDFIGINGEIIKLFDPKAPPFELGWPPNVMFIQPELEDALARAMDACPSVKCYRGVNVTSISQTENAAIVSGHDSAGERISFTANWVIGADGANSQVRATAGLEVEDLDFSEWWVVVDAWLTGHAKLPAKTTQYCHPSRPATFVVGPRNLRRWEIKLLPGELSETYRDENAVRALLANFVDVDALDIWRSAVYSFRAAVARSWRNGRLIIAGDAAHTMPPFLAQGLCAGLRDAGNLAWRLVQVIRHGAEASSLDSYEEERRPHVTEIIHHAKEFGLIIGELDAERAAERDKVLTLQLKTQSVPTERQAFVPPLRDGLIDSRSPSAGSLFVQGKVRVDCGEEALMDDIIGPQFLIIASDPDMLEIDAELNEKWSAIGGLRISIGDTAPNLLTIVDQDELLHGWLDRNDAKAVVVRPDRYVYGSATDKSDLERMIRQIFAAHGVS